MISFKKKKKKKKKKTLSFGDTCPRRRAMLDDHHRRHNAEEEEEEECFKPREKRKETLVVPHTYRISGVAKNKGVKSLFTSSRRILLS